MLEFIGNVRAVVISALVIAGAITFSLVVHQIIFLMATKLSRRKGTRHEHSIAARIKAPGRLVFPLLALVLALPLAPFPESVRIAILHLLELGVIASVGWGIVVLVQLVTDIIYARYVIDSPYAQHAADSPENISARRIRTQTQVLNRVVIAMVVIATIGMMLMTFPAVRALGTSLLASAGLAGLLLGVAARSTFANLIAGVQVALTQPIRLEDVVVIGGEWGWIEEISTTYVVVRLWDLRRLIVPVTYFIEKPFQNWTRTKGELLGSVILYADYRLPVDEIRQELHRILESSTLWDRVTWALHVIDVTERTIQMRALMSAGGPKMFELRCYVREKLIQYVQRNYPECLPRSRHEGKLVAADAL